eukprot:gb/GECG01004899.1/.p1 GENE.gb/GECG01004899.1/~~gb/GECG01004899.1/.p1  ORF type:complete len:443 (+),score=44.52 gb/GECG01004899.1/:1-1329(+)
MSSPPFRRHAEELSSDAERYRSQRRAELETMLRRCVGNRDRGGERQEHEQPPRSRTEPPVEGLGDDVASTLEETESGPLRIFALGEPEPEASEEAPIADRGQSTETEANASRRHNRRRPADPYTIPRDPCGRQLSDVYAIPSENLYQDQRQSQASRRQNRRRPADPFTIPRDPSGRQFSDAYALPPENLHQDQRQSQDPSPTDESPHVRMATRPERPTSGRLSSLSALRRSEPRAASILLGTSMAPGDEIEGVDYPGGVPGETYSRTRNTGENVISQLLGLRRRGDDQGEEAEGDQQRPGRIRRIDNEGDNSYSSNLLTRAFDQAVFSRFGRNQNAEGDEGPSTDPQRPDRIHRIDNEDEDNYSSEFESFRRILLSRFRRTNWTQNAEEDYIDGSSLFQRPGGLPGYRRRQRRVDRTGRGRGIYGGAGYSVSGSPIPTPVNH